MSVFDRKNALVTAPQGVQSDAEPMDWGDLPEKVNPQMPDAAWSITQESAKLATMHLNAMLQPHIFRHLSRRDQARFITIAMNRAYGSVDGAIRKHLHVNVKAEDREGYNEMSDMSRRAMHDLPELRRRRTGKFNGPAAEEAERVVPLRRASKSNSDGG